MNSQTDDNRTADVLAQRIQNDGPITVAEFMSTVADAYYARGDAFGADGDFITAPEISQVFGELIGLWAVTAWQAIGQPRSFHLVECGPGRGTLMADILRTVADIEPRFLHSASIRLVERSESLKERQAQALEGHYPKWHDDLSTLPDGPVIIIANEFLDALPIEQFVKTQSGWCDRLIAHDQDGFTFVAGSLPKGNALDAFEDAEAGSILEQSAAVDQLCQDLGTLCVERPGVALLIDYGHSTTAIGETLQAVRKHQFHPVLQQPGTADITAHVDFAAVTQSARSAGAKVHGPIEQGLWLRRLGINVRQAQLSEGRSKQEAAAINTSITRLIGREHMGSLFKVIALSAPSLPPLAGFETNADVC